MKIEVEIAIPQPQVDVFRTAETVYQMRAEPVEGYPVLVTLNGLVLLQNGDYDFIGQELRFTTQPLGQDPLIQVMYWVKPQ